MKKFLMAVLAMVMITGTTYAAEATFGASITIIRAVVVQEIRSLNFGEIISGDAQSKTIEPKNGALFMLSKDSGKEVNCSIINIVDMKNDSNDIITLTNFIINMDDDKIQIGATANIEANQTAGDYSGSATLLVVYK